MVLAQRAGFAGWLAFGASLSQMTEMSQGVTDLLSFMPVYDNL
jgi:hypothetical protein